MAYVALIAALLSPALLAIWLARRDRFALKWPRGHVRNVVGGGEENPVLLPVEPALREAVNGAEVDDLGHCSTMIEASKS